MQTHADSCFLDASSRVDVGNNARLVAKYQRLTANCHTRADTPAC
jgi:hypothetical protein